MSNLSRLCAPWPVPHVSVLVWQVCSCRATTRTTTRTPSRTTRSAKRGTDSWYGLFIQSRPFPIAGRHSCSAWSGVGCASPALLPCVLCSMVCSLPDLQPAASLGAASPPRSAFPSCRHALTLLVLSLPPACVRRRACSRRWWMTARTSTSIGALLDTLCLLLCLGVQTWARPVGVLLRVTPAVVEACLRCSSLRRST